MIALFLTVTLSLNLAVDPSAACSPQDASPSDATARADNRNLGLAEGIPGVAGWISQPTEIAPQVWQAWWWHITDPGTLSDGMNRAAFLFEIDCQQRVLRQRGYEFYADTRLLRRADQDQPPHTADKGRVSQMVLARVCDGERPEMTAATVDEAASHFRRH